MCIITICSAASKMAHQLNLGIFVYFTDENEKNRNRLFHNSPILKFIFGSFTVFVNGDFSHHCQFAFSLPARDKQVFTNNVFLNI